MLRPEPEIHGSLDELIYSVTSGALADAGLGIGDVSGVCMASSDLNDGRAISTMTLTGSTGSFGRTEMRVCNDGLAAVWLGAAEIGAGEADVLIVCAWNKFSDVVDPAAIPALAMEPAMHRGLGYHPDAVLALRRSQETGTVTLTEPSRIEPHDAAAAIVLVSPARTGSARVCVVGTGASTGPYLRPGEPVMAPARAAAAAACRVAGTESSALAAVVVAGMHTIDDDELCAAFGVTLERLVRAPRRWADTGYATGLLGVDAALDESEPGLRLVVSAGGIGMENAHAVVLETR
ncbi:hypothetical protein [Pseudonocardia sp. GCM10023141]|uniref:hypothetical protein n=1 Tax=Pseudonocardia sp. GCM10023141 TaxID=3252653 RepID=UPI00360F50E7